MKKLVWRLSKLPNPEELRGLVNDKIITHEEARAILFSEFDQEQKDIESFKNEIKFLRELVEKLSTSNTKIVETIKYIEKPYLQWEWYKPYVTWYNGNSIIDNNITTLSSGINLMGQANVNAIADTSFSNINTF